MSVKKIVSDLTELYKKLLGANEGASSPGPQARKKVKKRESIEDNSVDSFLDNLEKQAAENKRKIEDLGNV